MTIPERIAFGCWVASTIINIGMIFWRDRTWGRRLTEAHQKVADLIPCALFCVAMGHEQSPAPEEVKAEAHKAVPPWVMDKVQMSVHVVSEKDANRVH